MKRFVNTKYFKRGIILALAFVVFLLWRVVYDLYFNIPAAAFADKLLTLAAPLADKLSATALKIFPPDTAPFMTAFLTGNSDAWYSEGHYSSIFSATGIAHIVAISGMHLSILAGFLRTILGRNRVMPLITIPIIIVFTLITGASPSVVRAGIMTILLVASPLFDREYDKWRALFVSFVLLLFQNPHSVESRSLQMSYAAVLGIYLFADYFTKGFNRLTAKFSKRRGLGAFLKGFNAAAGVTFAANVAVFPITVFIFGQVSLISLPCNIAVEWAVTPTYILGALALGIGVFFPAAGSAVAWAASWFARFIMFAAEQFSRIPHTMIFRSSFYTSAWLIAVLSALAVVLFFRLKYKSEKLPKVRTALACFVLLTFVISQSANALSGTALPFKGFSAETFTSAALNVGQGLCAIHTIGNTAIVTDCGGSGYTNRAATEAVNYLQERNIYTVEALILTHFHDDHANGAAELLRRLPVRRLYVPNLTNDEIGTLGEYILAVARYVGTEVVTVSETETFTAGSERLTVTLYPPLGQIGATNERGVAICLSFRLDNGSDFDSFIAGDMDSETELRLLYYADLPDIELLFAAHHGSKYSGSDRFLRAVKPELAIISVGAYNHFGHPTPEAMERLTLAGAAIYRTDTNGTVEVTASAAS
ncbi:MAG: DNA internalization-related competence protein ComEC/Rec2 [Oscillospiraceae bacterium]|nr:DNA internalization-related competence protein ComEC/Rec2 [Oscillospiraceae bacterium]